jgi:hypothetical protein
MAGSVWAIRNLRPVFDQETFVFHCNFRQEMPRVRIWLTFSGSFQVDRRRPWLRLAKQFAEKLESDVRSLKGVRFRRTNGSLKRYPDTNRGSFSKLESSRLWA